MTPLCELAVKYGTNKCEEGYTPFYYELFKNRDITRVLELGIGGPGLSGGPSKWGASLFMWEEFFDQALIYGADIAPSLLIDRGAIKSYQVDVTNEASLKRLGDMTGGNFDLIIDDAVHLPGPQTLACKTLLPYLAHGGIYIIEDVANCHPMDIIHSIPDEYSRYYVQCRNWPLVVIFNH